uniref:Uncharacterized protein n=1 Tax=Heterorhabditis bacteriophora TaxID=37862 RepID=A0A1I7WLU1_HETBA
MTMTNTKNNYSVNYFIPIHL